MKKYVIFNIAVLISFTTSCNSKKEDKAESNILSANPVLIDTTQIKNEIDGNFISKYKRRFKDNYTIKFEKDCDLNKDGQTDKIFIFEPLKIKNNKQTKDSPVCVLIKKEKDYTIYENKNIIYTSFFNSMAEGLQDLVVKDNYFTIEENNVASDIRQNDYITFLYDLKSDKIILHKYGIEFISSDGENDSTVTYSNKDFNTINFSSFDIDVIKEMLIK